MEITIISTWEIIKLIILFVEQQKAINTLQIVKSCNLINSMTDVKTCYWFHTYAVKVSNFKIIINRSNITKSIK